MSCSAKRLSQGQSALCLHNWKDDIDWTAPVPYTDHVKAHRHHVHWRVQLAAFVYRYLIYMKDIRAELGTCGYFKILYSWKCYFCVFSHTNLIGGRTFYQVTLPEIAHFYHEIGLETIFLTTPQYRKPQMPSSDYLFYYYDGHII